MEFLTFLGWLMLGLIGCVCATWGFWYYTGNDLTIADCSFGLLFIVLGPFTLVVGVFLGFGLWFMAQDFTFPDYVVTKGRKQK